MITKIREKISSSPLWCKRLFSVAVLSLIFAISVTLVAFSSSVVTITDGDKTYSIRTSRDDVSYLLEKAGITVSADDCGTGQRSKTVPIIKQDKAPDNKSLFIFFFPFIIIMIIPF